MDLAAASPEYTELKAQMEELKRQNLVIGDVYKRQCRRSSPTPIPLALTIGTR